ncbi:MAG: VWA domain-containing protein [Chloroflexi bacterium]|nr:VWA domain-containing protein [Chloroflexota bacterium]
MVKDEILKRLTSNGRDVIEGLFSGLEVGSNDVEEILSTLVTGHHLLILGPPGSGKTAVANRLGTLLGDIEVVEGCPVNCAPGDAYCPWCLERKRNGEPLKTVVVRGSDRLKKIQGGSEVTPEDMVGSIDPESALAHGIHSVSAFSPGKLLRANKGVLVVDFIDRMPERALNTLLYALEGGRVNLGAYDEQLDLDILVVATGSPKMLEFLPLGVLEYFDIVTLGYVDDPAVETRIDHDNLERRPAGQMLDDITLARAVEIANLTRSHSEIERGISTRGSMRYTELLASMQEMGVGGREEMLRGAAFSTLPHRLQLAPHADLPGKRDQVIQEILDEVLGGKQKVETLDFSRDDLMSLVEEIAREDKFRKPLKYGAFDILLKRVQRFPESKLAEMVRAMSSRMEELYPDRYRKDNVTEELLMDIEESRKREERITKLRKAMELDALSQTIGYLEQHKILEKGKQGWELSRKGLSLLLERLTPKLVTSSVYGYGKHTTGKKLSIGIGREVGIRHFRFGDKYKDVTVKNSIREAIRNHRNQVTKDDIMVVTRDVRTSMDVILVVDLSGTMRQLEKLWHAKECSIALSLAASQFKDRVGVVSFSNMADVVVDITANPYRLTRRVIDLELHPNSFTNIGYGILKAMQLFSYHRRSKASQHMIVISDGDATAPHPSPKKYALRQATRAAKKGITISTICINEESADPELMRRIARIGKGRIYYIGEEALTAAILEERMAAKATL